LARKRTGFVPLAWSLLFLLVISLASMTFPAHAVSSDLTIDSIWLEDASQIGQPVSQLSPGQSFNIVATIKNIGQDTASNYYLDVYCDSDYGRGGPDNIAPGEVQTWYVGPLTAQAGTHTTKWVVDPDNQIAELDETNNQKELVFTVGSQTTTTTVASSSPSSTTQSTSTTTVTQTSSSTPSTTQLTSTSTTSSSTSSATSTSTSSTSESTSTSTSYTTEPTSTVVTSTTTATMTSTSTSSTSESTSTMASSTSPSTTGSIVSVSDSPDPVARRGTVNFSVTVKNTGNIVWSSSTVTIKIYRPDGTLVATPKVTVKSIQPGGQYIYRISWRVPYNAPTGIWHYEAYVNYAGVLIASSTNPANTITVR